MGCDIHGWIEIKKDNKWIAIQEMPNRDRNYMRFTALANVRSYGGYEEITPKEPLGIPRDISNTTKYWIEMWNEDGHSHSYMPIKEAAEIFKNTDYNLNDYKIKWPISAYFEIEDDEEDIENMRLVFWFDN